jgi:hypothetical protein
MQPLSFVHAHLKDMKTIFHTTSFIYSCALKDFGIVPHATPFSCPCTYERYENNDSHNLFHLFMCTVFERYCISDSHNLFLLSQFIWRICEQWLTQPSSFVHVHLKDFGRVTHTTLFFCSWAFERFLNSDSHNPLLLFMGIWKIFEQWLTQPSSFVHVHLKDFGTVTHTTLFFCSWAFERFLNSDSHNPLLLFMCIWRICEQWLTQPSSFVHVHLKDFGTVTHATFFCAPERWGPSSNTC